MLLLHKPKGKNDDITTNRISNQTHIYWKKKHFHKDPLYFRIYPDFEADNEKDNSSTGNKTTNMYKQNPVLNAYQIESELEDNLKRGYHKSHFGYNKVDWFVDEVIELEKKGFLF